MSEIICDEEENGGHYRERNERKADKSWVVIADTQQTNQPLLVDHKSLSLMRPEDKLNAARTDESVIC